ncbi:MAG: APC family permease [Promethearchaeia archaeon]
MGENFTEHIEKVKLFSLTILGIGALTGAGIYSLLGLTGQIAGPATIISLIIGSLFSFIAVSFYSEVISVKPINGGSFVYVKEAYGEKALYLGWLTWLANMSYGALVAHTLGSFIVSFLNLNEYLITPLAIGFVLLMAYVNLKGSRFLSRIQIPLTTSLVLSLIIGSIFLFLNPNPSIDWNLEYFFPNGIFAIIPAAALLFVIFIGFEDICTIAEEVEKPRKNIPKAYYMMISITTVIYLLVIISLYISTDLNSIQQSEIAFLDAVSTNNIIYFIVYLGAIFSLLTTLGISLMAQSRNLVGLSINDFTDRKYAEIDADANAPVKAIKLSSIILILIVLSGQVEFFASITVVAYMIIINSLALTVFKFRKTKKKMYSEDTFKVPLHPYSTILAMVLSGLLIMNIELSIIFVPIIWLFIGLILYLFFSSKKRIYGTIFLITAFFFALSNLMLGLIILAVGFSFYFISISDNPSVQLTLTGLKFFFTLVTGFFILIISVGGQIEAINPIFTNILISIISTICLFSLITVFFEIVPLKEILYYILKKERSKEVVIQTEEGQIIELSEREKRFIFIFNEIIGIIQLVFFALILLIVIFFLTDFITLEKLIIGDFILSEKSSQFLFILMLVIFDSILGTSGGVFFYINHQSKKIGV